MALGASIGFAPSPAAAHPGASATLERVESDLVLRPGELALHRRAAELRLAAGDLDGAARALAAAERISPADPLTRLLHARVHLARGETALARRNAELAMHALPEDPRARLLRADALGREGQHAAAAADLDRAIALQSRPRPEHFLARARQWRLAGNTHRALDGLDAAVAALGPIVALEQEAIDIELELGRVDAALARHARLTASYERTEAALAERGDLLVRAGQVPAALATWTEALTICDASAPDARTTALAASLRERLRSSGELGVARP